MYIGFLNLCDFNFLCMYACIFMIFACVMDGNNAANFDLNIDVICLFLVMTS